MIDPTSNGARSQIKPDLRTSLTQRQMLLLNQQVSMRAAGEDACLMIIFGQQGMIEVQTSKLRVEEFWYVHFSCLKSLSDHHIHNNKLLLDIFRDADPGRRWANKRGSARGRGNSVIPRKRSCRCTLPPGKTVKSRGFFGPAIKLRTTKSQIVGGVALGNFVAGKIKLQCYRLEQLTSKVLWLSCVEISTAQTDVQRFCLLFVIWEIQTSWKWN